MPCFKPLQGYMVSGGGWSADPVKGMHDKPMSVACGRCMGCRLERSRQWAVRIMHEAKCHEENSFITLTYDDENLPDYGSLRLEHFQKFMKRLRKEVAPKKVRYYHVGEYGEKLGRPHYHACVFGHSFDDRFDVRMRRGYPVWRSKQLERLWPYGFSEVGPLTFESAAYAARYITKKVYGDSAEDHYQAVDVETGELIQIRPEYTTMSRRPGIGRKWFEKWKEDVYPSDEVIINGRPQLPPRYYDDLMEKEDPELMRKIRLQRRLAHDPEENTEERLAVREECFEARNASMDRSYENG